MAPVRLWMKILYLHNVNFSQSKENYFSFGWVTMHFWHPPVGVWKGFTNQRDRKIYLTCSASHQNRTFRIRDTWRRLIFAYCNWRGHPNNTPPVMAVIMTHHGIIAWRWNNDGAWCCETGGRNELAPLCLLLGVGSRSRRLTVSELVKAEPKNPYEERGRVVKGRSMCKQASLATNTTLSSG